MLTGFSLGNLNYFSTPSFFALSVFSSETTPGLYNIYSISHLMAQYVNTDESAAHTKYIITMQPYLPVCPFTHPPTRNYMLVGETLCLLLKQAKGVIILNMGHWSVTTLHNRLTVDFLLIKLMKQNKTLIYH